MRIVSGYLLFNDNFMKLTPNYVFFIPTCMGGVFTTHLSTCTCVSLRENVMIFAILLHLFQEYLRG